MDMDILSWNCRGICGDSTVRPVKDLITQNRRQIVFLCETKIGNTRTFEHLRLSLGFAQGFVSGGLAAFWNDDVKVLIGTSSLHHIDMEIDGGPEDFNEILNNGEKMDGPMRPERQMRGFREALGYGDPLDLGFMGPTTTWWNSETKLRLDRAVCTLSWYDIFAHARVQHLPPSDSDHLPILLHASSVPIPKRPRLHRFKLEAHWLQHGECDGVVKEAWMTDVMGSPMYQVAKKIRYTRLKLDAWQKNIFRGRQM
ncbi:hypothetical protein ACLB2K_056440 [Fragaria x ananassa]